MSVVELESTACLEFELCTAVQELEKLEASDWELVGLAGCYVSALAQEFATAERFEDP